jgi:hypothetical protein
VPGPSQSLIVAAPPQSTERAAQANLRRDIFGNPFRAAHVDSRWLIPEVVERATVMYEQGMLDQMPILERLLMNMGCNDETILGHCRLEGHVRGCWLVDGLLGKP